MVTNAKEDKVNVFNSVEILSPVGVELKDILENNGLDIATISNNLNIDKNLETISKLTKQHLKLLKDTTNIECISDYLASYQESYKERKAKAEDAYKQYLSIYKKYAYVIDLTLAKFNTGIDRLNDFADFIGAEDEIDIPNFIKDKAALYKVTGGTVDEVALFVWKRRGDVLFKDLNLPSYNREALCDWIDKGIWKSRLNDESYLKSLPTIFSEMGVGLILDPFVEKTVYGYVDWIEGNPLIQISDRGKSLATCWYVLFHELGHVLLHQDCQIFEGGFEFSRSKMSKIEQEANDFAFKYLFNGHGLQKFIFGNKADLKNATEDCVCALASRFNVHPMFVTFWMQKAGIGNYLVKKFTPSIKFEYHI